MVAVFFIAMDSEPTHELTEAYTPLAQRVTGLAAEVLEKHRHWAHSEDHPGVGPRALLEVSGHGHRLFIEERDQSSIGRREYFINWPERDLTINGTVDEDGSAVTWGKFGPGSEINGGDFARLEMILSASKPVED